MKQSRLSINCVRVDRGESDQNKKFVFHKSLTRNQSNWHLPSHLTPHRLRLAVDKM